MCITRGDLHILRMHSSCAEKWQTADCLIKAVPFEASGLRQEHTNQPEYSMRCISAFTGDRKEGMQKSAEGIVAPLDRSEGPNLK